MSINPEHERKRSIPSQLSGVWASMSRYVTRRRRPQWLPLAGSVIIVVFIVTAIGADLIAPHSPTEVDLQDRLLPPAWAEGGSMKNLLGTDRIGRDLLSRIIHGSQVSLEVALATVVLGVGLGTLVGLLAGYFGGIVDIVLMRLVDLMLSIPLILFALLFVVLSRPSMLNVIIAIALVLWARFARVIRGEVLSVRERDYVGLARIAGASNTRIIRKHILPNVVNTVVVLATLQIGFIILVEASLSFLGAGIPPPEPSWGSLIADGRGLVTSAWWLSLFPGLATLLVVLAFNLLGDWLRDRLDPRIV